MCIIFTIRCASAFIYHYWYAPPSAVSVSSFAPQTSSFAASATADDLWGGPWLWRLSLLHSALIVLENVSLLELTSITSKDSGSTHEIFFILFIVAATTGMLLQFPLLNRKIDTLTALAVAGGSDPGAPALSLNATMGSQGTVGATQGGTGTVSAAVAAGAAATVARLQRSRMYKSAFCVLWLGLLCAAAYLFQRHNAMCEPGIYSLFALSEYFLVASNIAFNSTLAMDVPGGAYTFTMPHYSLAQSGGALSGSQSLPQSQSHYMRARSAVAARGGGRALVGAAAAIGVAGVSGVTGTGASWDGDGTADSDGAGAVSRAGPGVGAGGAGAAFVAGVGAVGAEPVARGGWRGVGAKAGM